MKAEVGGKVGEWGRTPSLRPGSPDTEVGGDGATRPRWGHRIGWGGLRFGLKQRCRSKGLGAAGQSARRATDHRGPAGRSAGKRSRSARGLLLTPPPHSPRGLAPRFRWPPEPGPAASLRRLPTRFPGPEQTCPGSLPRHRRRPAGSAGSSGSCQNFSH